MAKKKDIRGELALITGAGRGIGRAIAFALGRAGARIAVADLDRRAAEETVLDLGRAGIDARAYTVDVRDRAAFESLAAKIEAELAPIEILVNNAGIMTLGSFFEHGDKEDAAQLSVNVIGVANGMRAVVPRMQARRRGHVVNIASMAGRIGASHAAMYCATKHAVIGLTEAVRDEIWGSGVDFSYVMPALVRTELIDGAKKPLWPPVKSPDEVAEAVLEAIQKNQLEVYVPRGARISVILPAFLPRRALDAIKRALGVNRMFDRFDRHERSSYIARTSGADGERASSNGNGGGGTIGGVPRPNLPS